MELCAWHCAFSTFLSTNNTTQNNALHYKSTTKLQGLIHCLVQSKQKLNLLRVVLMGCYTALHCVAQVLLLFISSLSTFTGSGLLLHKAFCFDRQRGVLEPNHCVVITWTDLSLPTMFSRICHKALWWAAIKWGVVKLWVEMNQFVWPWLDHGPTPLPNRFLE